MNTIPMNLTIAGTAHADTAWKGNGLVVDAWGWDLDGDLTLEFHEEGPAVSGIWIPSYKGGQTASLAIGASPVTVASGEINFVGPVFVDDGWTFGYRCRGPRYRAQRIPATANDGTGTVVYNMPVTDPAWTPSLTGQDVGQIIAQTLGLAASQLATVGISTDATTATQLAALTLVPADTVYMTGPVLESIDALLRQWARNVVQWIDPTGLLRYFDPLNGTAITITEGTDPFIPFRWTYDLADVATRVEIRGGGDIRPAMLKMSQTWGGSNHYLKWAQTSAQQAAWNESSFTQPAGAFDSGTVVSIGGPTSVTLQSSNSAQTAALNFWGQNQAWLHLYNSTGTGLTFTESAPITANTAETAGNPFTVTLGFDLQNAGPGAYDSYTIVGGATPLGSSAGQNLVDVWRLMDVNDPGGLIANHLVKSFPMPVPWTGYYGDSTVGTTVPSALVVFPSGQTWPADFDIVPQTGQIRFRRPVVELTTSSQNLATGGSAVTPPADIYVLLAYSRGPLTSIYPPNSGTTPVYSGTAYSDLGFERTLVIDMDTWVYAGNQAQFDAYAQMMQAAVSVAPYKGDCKYLGPLPATWLPMTTAGTTTFGLMLNVAGNGYTTGMESKNVTIRSARVSVQSDGSGGVLYTTQLSCNAKRNPTTSDRYYIHPTTAAQLTFKLPSWGAATVPQALVSQSPEIAGLMSQIESMTSVGGDS